MKISNNGLALIRKFEGCRLKAYRCPSNVLTIGWGHTEGVYEGQIITQEEADNMLIADMEKYEDYVNVCKTLTFTPNQNQFDALVSFTYNCGVGNLITLVKDRDSNTVAEKMLLYVNGANGVLEGLVKRRQAEHDLFLSGEVTHQEEQVNNIDTDVFKLQQECNAQGFSKQVVDGIAGINTLNGCPTLRNGSRGIITGIMQRLLQRHGYDLQTSGADGDFGNETLEQIIQFQCDNELDADGIVGKNTWRKLLNL